MNSLSNVSLGLAVVLLVAGAARAQTTHDDVARSLELSEPRGQTTEIRVWVRQGAARVSTVYRIVSEGHQVFVERFAWTRTVAPVQGETTVRQARDETKLDRRLLGKERCLGKIRETAAHLWCRLSQPSAAYGPSLFDDLLPDELWKLPPQSTLGCKPYANGDTTIVLDGEALEIEIMKDGSRHSVLYVSPDICCPTLACAIAGHVRQVLQRTH